MNHKTAHCRIGRGFSCRSNVILNVSGNGQLVIGDKVFLNDNCCINCRGQTTIGDNVIVGQNVLFYDHDHEYENLSRMIDFFHDGKITIGNNVWIGAGVIILRDTVIEDNTVIAAGSIVKGKVPYNHLFLNPRKFESRLMDRK